MKSNYLKYAVGEVLLVIAGILIALSIDSWLEQREYQRYETLMLQEILAAIERDKQLIDNIYLPRIEQKRLGIEELTQMVTSTEALNREAFSESYSRMGTGINFQFDDGAYEVLKTSGFDRVTNADLRAELTNTYETFLPMYEEFIDLPFTESNQRIEGYSIDFLIPSVTRLASGETTISQKLSDSNVLTNPSFLRVLQLENELYENYRTRLETVITVLDLLKQSLSNELAKRNE